MSITDELRKWGYGFCGSSYEVVNAIADRIDAAVEGMVELPKDADDVPWNVGDCDEDGNEVIALKLASDGWFVITNGEWLHRPGKHHYHAPTVEDVLREFAEGLGVPVADSYVAAAAAKLTLRGDE